jgi:hypothetical protein
VWAEECGESERRSVMDQIGIERNQYHPMRKQADFHMVFLYKRVYRTFEGGKANEYS